MEIKVNNEARVVDSGMTVARLIGDNTAGVAVAVNGKVVRKSEWETAVLNDGDDVVVIHAAYGG
ncbi:MAG: sulfur carrier protein ThiS [Bacteroides sp.]|nr:sulfur carrier protein ThiS [Bacteroides sp.]